MEIRPKRKAHNKSRQGCSNCKIRRIKCDEGKPTCKKCLGYKVFCNFDSNFDDLQLSVKGDFSVQTLWDLSIPQDKHFPKAIARPLKNQSILSLGSTTLSDLSEQDLELVNKFQSRTVYTIGNDRVCSDYQTQMIGLACSHPFLMHAVVSLTLMHDRSLSTRPNRKLSATEAFHWYQSTALFNSKISQRILPSERDAVWAATVLLGIIAFYHVDAESSEAAWPLTPNSPLDLNWLWMGDGKAEIWKLSQPWRAESVWKAAACSYRALLEAPPTVRPIDTLPFELVKLCDLEDVSNALENPYHLATSSLAQSWTTESMITINMNFLAFTMNMAADYKQLLRAKDPRALLLLAYWYGKVCQHPLWWIYGRAAVELRAICIYLHRYHFHDTFIKELLTWPEEICGFAVS